MREEYASNEEYPAYFETLAGLRNKIAKTLPLKKDMYILHLATGQGYFSVEIAKRWKGIMVTGINLTEGNIE